MHVAARLEWEAKGLGTKIFDSILNEIGPEEVLEIGKLWSKSGFQSQALIPPLVGQALRIGIDPKVALSELVAEWAKWQEELKGDEEHFWKQAGFKNVINGLQRKDSPKKRKGTRRHPAVGALLALVLATPHFEEGLSIIPFAVGLGLIALAVLWLERAFPKLATMQEVQSGLNRKWKQNLWTKKGA